MLRGILLLTLAASLSLAGSLLADSATTNPPPDFNEVYGLLRAHLPGATEASLDQAAVAGLLSQFNGRAALVGDNIAPVTMTCRTKPPCWIIPCCTCMSPI